MTTLTYWLDTRCGLSPSTPSTSCVAGAPVRLLRSGRERVFQALCFEALGLLIVSPLFAWCTGTSAAESVFLLVVLSLTMLCWTDAYNTAFDRIEFGCTGRVASARPHGMRAVHTLGNEASAAVVTWPLIVMLTPLGWLDALFAEVGLTMAYALYGYLFHIGFDRWRPVGGPAPSKYHPKESA